MDQDDSESLCIVRISLWIQDGVYYLRAFWNPTVVPGEVVHNLLDRSERAIGGYERWSYRHFAMGSYSYIEASIPARTIKDSRYPHLEIEINNDPLVVELG